MARDTRAASAGKDAAMELSSIPTKRKRRSSPSPVLATPLKVVLPSPSSIAHSLATPTNNASPPKTNGDRQHEPKRPKISLTVSSNGLRKSPVPEEKEEEMKQEGEIPDVEEDEEDEKEPKATPLSREIRGALALVISQMAGGLPSPLNGILRLWLPPDFAQKAENTLDHVLRQDDLTWEALVGVVHVFSENLLVPCSYPNPMPSLAQFHFPIPPLPSHYPPHIIYNFCASLHSLMLQIEPPSEALAQPVGERWTLMQKTPSNGSAGQVGGEWFTASVDMRAAAVAKQKLGKDVDVETSGSLLEALAMQGDKFGCATAVSVQSTLAASAVSKSKVPKLSETVIRRASLKMQRWKDQRSKGRAGGFGSIARGVSIPAMASTSFTPTFGPTFDSSSSTGGIGYLGTLQAIHERARHKEWSRRVLRRSGLGNLQLEREGWWGSLDTEQEEVSNRGAVGKSKGRAVDEVLSHNVGLIEELQSWQEVRLRKGDESWIPKRERRIAEDLLESLTDLAKNVSPSELFQSNGLKSSLGLAHDLARRFVPTPSPIIRGTLDPRRPHALHDNTTVRLRSPGAQSLSGLPSGISSPHAPPPARPSYGYMAPPPLPHQLPPPPPHTVSAPSSSRYQMSARPPSNASTAISPQSYHSSQNASSGSSRPQPTPIYNPYTPNALGTSVYGRTTSSTTPVPTRPGPGPSSLRQSFGPTTPGSPFGAQGPAKGPPLIMMAQQQSR